MPTKREVSMTGFEIVAYAGDAQSDLFEALECARKGDFERARTLAGEASTALGDAHGIQTRLLSEEAGGAEMEVTFIMVHAQDTLMTTMLLEKQVLFFIDEYERIASLESKLSV